LRKTERLKLLASSGRGLGLTSFAKVSVDEREIPRLTPPKARQGDLSIRRSDAAKKQDGEVTQAYE
jgi:hypothetical protein